MQKNQTIDADKFSFVSWSSNVTLILKYDVTNLEILTKKIFYKNTHLTLNLECLCKWRYTYKPKHFRGAKNGRKDIFKCPLIF